MTTSDKTKWRESLIKQDAVIAARAEGYREGEREGAVNALNDAIDMFAGSGGHFSRPTIEKMLKELRDERAGDNIPFAASLTQDDVDALQRATARIAYQKALQDVKAKFAELDLPFAITVIDQLSAYEKGSDDGKAE